MASSSRGQQRMEDVYEQQNDQRLDELHSKLRTLKGITTDIHADVESQNLMIDSTSDRFASFGGQLSQASLRARQAFGIGPGAGTLKPWRIAMLIVALFITFWLGGKVLAWWASDGYGVRLTSTILLASASAWSVVATTTTVFTTTPKTNAAISTTTTRTSSRSLDRHHNRCPVAVMPCAACSNTPSAQDPFPGCITLEFEGESVITKRPFGPKKVSMSDIIKLATSHFPEMHEFESPERYFALNVVVAPAQTGEKRKLTMIDYRAWDMVFRNANYFVRDRSQCDVSIRKEIALLIPVILLHRSSLIIPQRDAMASNPDAPPTPEVSSPKVPEGCLVLENASDGRLTIVKKPADNVEMIDVAYLYHAEFYQNNSRQDLKWGYAIYTTHIPAFEGRRVRISDSAWPDIFPKSTHLIVDVPSWQ
ncbi:hypothetical protein NMY22_g6033 [Coprinellus aureogranulatus]|nr:hypothetical protein NMY22_g6033 [Coprinellus aureogranulatus]